MFMSPESASKTNMQAKRERERNKADLALSLSTFHICSPIVTAATLPREKKKEV